MKCSHVYFVGAGPGDPELLTFKAAKAIAKADVILIDDLVNPAVLSHAQSQARVTWVGKRGGCQSTPQAFIEKLMVREAKAGQTVVRLKGGDPTIFGRLGEEIKALKEAGIGFEVISGISSGLAAAAACSVSLTHRDHSHGVVLLTGHAKPGGEEPNIAALVLAQFTVVLYMGLAKADQIVANLLNAGVSPDLSVGLVEAVSTSTQKMIRCTVASLGATILLYKVSSPALIVIGRVTESIDTIISNDVFLNSTNPQALQFFS